MPNGFKPITYRLGNWSITNEPGDRSWVIHNQLGDAVMRVLRGYPRVRTFPLPKADEFIRLFFGWLRLQNAAGAPVNEEALLAAPHCQDADPYSIPLFSINDEDLRILRHPQSQIKS